MINILLFFYVFTVTLVFTAPYKWFTIFASAIVALAFYGVNEIGQCMEDPFGWEEPNHDLTALGWRIYRENLKIHETVDMMEKEDHMSLSGAEGQRLKDILQFAKPKASLLRSESDATVERELSEKTDKARAALATARSSAREDDDPVAVDVGRKMAYDRLAWITTLFAIRNTVWPRIIAQIILAGVVGVAAEFLKRVVCGAYVPDAAKCLVTLEADAHTNVGIVLGFLLVFRIQLAYDRFYEGKESQDYIYESIRNLNVAFAAFMRVPVQGEEGYNGAVTDAYARKLSSDRLEVLRLSNLLFSTIRQAVRE